MKFPVNNTNTEIFSAFGIHAVFIPQRLIVERSIEPIEQLKQ